MSNSTERFSNRVDNYIRYRPTYPPVVLDILREEIGLAPTWRIADVGSGYSTPAIVGDRVYLLGNDGLENEFVRALNAADGKTIWTAKLGKVGNPNQKPSFPGARSTPTVVGDVLFDRPAQAARARRLALHLRQHRDPQDAVGVLMECELVEDRPPYLR